MITDSYARFTIPYNELRMLARRLVVAGILGDAIDTISEVLHQHPGQGTIYEGGNKRTYGVRIDSIPCVVWDDQEWPDGGCEEIDKLVSARIPFLHVHAAGEHHRAMLVASIGKGDKRACDCDEHEQPVVYPKVENGTARIHPRALYQIEQWTRCRQWVLGLPDSGPQKPRRTTGSRTVTSARSPTVLRTPA